MNILKTIPNILILNFLSFIFLSSYALNQVPPTPPIFSKESGFYQNEFNLILSLSNSDNNTLIYYTDDSSDPKNSTTSKLYTSPIQIYDHSSDQNIYSEYQEDDTPQSISRGINYKKPTYNVDKAMIIRAVTKLNNIFSEVISHTYFITNKNLKKYENFTVISIITDPKNLFDSDIGIYVVGNQFFEWKNSDDYDPLKNVYATDNKCNYFGKGKKWEREAKITVFEKKEIIINKKIGLRLKGSSTRNNPGKSFEIINRKKYGNEIIKTAKLLPNNFDKFGKLITEYESFSLRSVYEEGRLRDRYGQKIIYNRENIDTQSMKEAILFLNGEYWGLYEIIEKINNDYIKNHYNISKEKIILIKENQLKEGTQENFNEYITTCEEYSNKNLSLNENYNIINNIFDMDSFIEHYVFGIYIGTSDWPGRNFAIWKNSENGKWKFITFDLDYTMGKALSKGGVDFDNFLHIERKKDIPPTNLFLALLKNDEFKKKFVNMFCDYINDVMKYEKINKLMKEFENNLIDIASSSQVRWEGCSKNKLEYNECYAYYKTIFQKSINNIINFFKERPKYIIQYMKNYLYLNGNLKNLTITIQGKGKIKINSIIPEFISNQWTGVYFDDIPIELTAINFENYIFKNWYNKNNLISENNTIILTLKEPIEITANFEFIYNTNNTILSPPIFSKESGFYSEEFDLILTSNDSETKIYYTLDGSDPFFSNTTIEYTKPIKIYDKSNEQNKYCTYIEDENSPQSISRGNFYKSPSYLLDKTMIIRALVKKINNNILSETIDNTYFITTSNLKYYSNFTVISLITDPKNLFDENFGIYVTGNQFIEWKNSIEYDDKKSIWDTDNKCNYFCKGKNWEKDATITFFKEGKVFINNKKIGLRIKGGTTRNNAGKSFKIIPKEKNFQSEYLISNNFDINENIIDTYDNIELRCVHEERRLRNEFVKEILKKRKNFYKQNMNDAILFLDGEYWGFYQILEIMDNRYIRNHYEINKNNVTIIKENLLKYGDINEYEKYINFVNKYANYDLSEEENYQIVEKYLDLDSMIEHYVIGIYLGLADWPTQNYGVWKENNLESKWKFFTYDLDYTMGNGFENEVVNSYARGHFAYMERKKNEIPTNLFLALLKNKKFRNKFINIYCDYANEIMKIDNILPLIEKYKNEKTDILAYSQLRWWGGNSKNEGYQNWKKNYLNNVLPSIKTYLMKRPKFALEYMKDYLNLNGKFYILTIVFSGEGKIKINSIEIEGKNDSKWEGKYFSEVSIEISVDEIERFIKWSGDLESDEKNLQINMEKNIEIKVEFEKIDTEY